MLHVNLMSNLHTKEAMIVMRNSFALSAEIISFFKQRDSMILVLLLWMIQEILVWVADVSG